VTTKGRGAGHGVFWCLKEFSKSLEEGGGGITEGKRGKNKRGRGPIPEREERAGTETTEKKNGSR